MKFFGLRITPYTLVRDLATLCMLGILAGYMLPIPIILWRTIFVLLCFLAVVKQYARLTKVEGYMLTLVGWSFLYWFIAHLWDTSPTTTLIGAILFTMPGCVLFRWLQEKGAITNGWLMVAAILFLIAGMYYYRYNYYKVLAALMTNEEIDITNNASTVFLGLIPFLMLVRSRIIQWIGLLVCWFFLLSAAKRGNILGASLPTLLFLWPYIKESRRSLWKSLLLAAALAVAVVLGSAWFMESSLLQEKIARAAMGDSNGRSTIYAMYLNAYSLSESFKNLIFGYGFNGTLAVGDIHAHNDWIEILFDYGLVGLVLEFCIFSSLLKLCKTKSTQRLIFIAITFIWLEKSMVSMNYADPNNIWLYASLGIVLGKAGVGVKRTESNRKYKLSYQSDVHTH